MKKVFCLLLLAGCPLVFLPPDLPADEQPAAEKPQVEDNISAEDQKVIELMELLQMMELLQDFDVMTAGKENK